MGCPRRPPRKLTARAVPAGSQGVGVVLAQAGRGGGGQECPRLAPEPPGTRQAARRRIRPGYWRRPGYRDGPRRRSRRRRTRVSSSSCTCALPSSLAIRALSPRRRVRAKLRAAATRTLPPGGPRAAPMTMPGRIRASTPPLICSTGISWQGCGAVSPPAPRAEGPAPGTQAQTLSGNDRQCPAVTGRSGTQHAVRDQTPQKEPVQAGTEGSLSCG